MFKLHKFKISTSKTVNFKQFEQFEWEVSAKFPLDLLRWPGSGDRGEKPGLKADLSRARHLAMLPHARSADI